MFADINNTSGVANSTFDASFFDILRGNGTSTFMLPSGNAIGYYVGPLQCDMPEGTSDVSTSKSSAISRSARNQVRVSHRFPLAFANKH
jgi:hypothetical protein